MVFLREHFSFTMVFLRELHLWSQCHSGVWWVGGVAGGSDMRIRCLFCISLAALCSLRTAFAFFRFAPSSLLGQIWISRLSSRRQHRERPQELRPRSGPLRPGRDSTSCSPPAHLARQLRPKRGQKARGAAMYAFCFLFAAGAASGAASSHARRPVPESGPRC